MSVRQSGRGAVSRAATPSTALRLPGTREEPTVPAARAVARTAAPNAAPTSVADLLDAHGAEIYRHLRRLSPTAEDAADLHQETFLRAHRAWPRLPPEANHRAWLHRIAANVAVDAHRRRGARGGVPPTGTMGDRPGSTRGAGNGAGRATRPNAESDAGPAAGPRTDPAARAEAAELREAVRSALASLPGREATAVAARVLDGLEYGEVAVMLGCTDANARQIASRGLRRMRAALTTFMETDR